MGGNRVMPQGSGDDSFDEEGYDESQRAEILEATRDGPSDGTILTDLDPDVAGLDKDDADEPEDDLVMEDGEVGEEDATVTMAGEDMDEDDEQDDFDTNATVEDGDLDDGADVATRP